MSDSEERAKDRHAVTRIGDCLYSPGRWNREGRFYNVTDALFSIAEALERVAQAIENTRPDLGDKR